MSNPYRTDNERKVFYIDVGDLDPKDVAVFLEGVRAAMKAINESSYDVIPTRGDKTK